MNDNFTPEQKILLTYQRNIVLMDCNDVVVVLREFPTLTNAVSPDVHSGMKNPGLMVAATELRPD